jgi:MFS family permease
MSRTTDQSGSSLPAAEPTPAVSAAEADRTAGKRRLRAPLAWQRKGYRQLTRAWVFTNLADSALYLMMAVWVKDLTGSDAAAAIVFAMLGLAALSAPFLGQLADRVSRKRVLVVANLTMVPIVLALLLVARAGDVWLVYVVIGVYGCVGYLTAAAQSGLIRDLLPDEELASGNGLLTTIDQAARLLSPLIGTALYVAVGPHAVVIGTAACFAITGILLTRVSVAESEPTPKAERGGYLHELSAGIRHLFTTPTLGVLTVVIAIAFAATGLTNVTIFPALEQGFGLDTAWLGVMVTIQGIGSLLGGVTAAAVIGRLGENRTVALGMVLLAIGFLPVAGSIAWIAIVGGAVIGFGVTWTVVAYVTLRQRVTPPRLQGRAGAAANVMLNLPQTVAMLGAAAVIVVVDYRMLILATVGVILVAAIACRPFRRVSSARPEPGAAS